MENLSSRDLCILCDVCFTSREMLHRHHIACHTVEELSRLLLESPVHVHNKSTINSESCNGWQHAGIKRKSSMYDSDEQNVLIKRVKIVEDDTEVCQNSSAVPQCSTNETFEQLFPIDLSIGKKILTGTKTFTSENIFTFQESPILAGKDLRSILEENNSSSNSHEELMNCDDTDPNSGSVFTEVNGKAHGFGSMSPELCQMKSKPENFHRKCNSYNENSIETFEMKRQVSEHSCGEENVNHTNVISYWTQESAGKQNGSESPRTTRLPAPQTIMSQMMSGLSDEDEWPELGDDITLIDDEHLLSSLDLFPSLLDDFVIELSTLEESGALTVRNAEEAPEVPRKLEPRGESVAPPASSVKCVNVPASSKEIVLLPASIEEIVSLPASSEKCVHLPASSKEGVPLPASNYKIVSLPASGEKGVHLPASSEEIVSLPASIEENATFPASSEEEAPLLASSEKIASLPASNEEGVLLSASSEEGIPIPGSSESVSLPASSEEHPLLEFKKILPSSACHPTPTICVHNHEKSSNYVSHPNGKNVSVDSSDISGCSKANRTIFGEALLSKSIVTCNTCRNIESYYQVTNIEISNNKSESPFAVVNESNVCEFGACKSKSSHENRNVTLIRESSVKAAQNTVSFFGGKTIFRLDRNLITTCAPTTKEVLPRLPSYSSPLVDNLTASNDTTLDFITPEQNASNETNLGFTTPKQNASNETNLSFIPPEQKNISENRCGIKNSSFTMPVNSFSKGSRVRKEKRKVFSSHIVLEKTPWPCSRTRSGRRVKAAGCSDFIYSTVDNSKSDCAQWDFNSNGRNGEISKSVLFKEDSHRETKSIVLVRSDDGKIQLKKTKLWCSSEEASSKSELPSTYIEEPMKTTGNNSKIAGKRRANKIDVRRNTTRISRVFNVECSYCGHQLSSEVLRTISKHDLGHHKVCISCKKGHYLKRSAILDHESVPKVGSLQRAGQCSICDTYVTNVRRHIERVHEQQRVQCEVCHASVKKDCLKSHKNRKHGPASPVECDHCTKLFKSASSLREHLTRVRRKIKTVLEYICD
ncbi:uncharacterized protein LOC108669162 [Hyalella azteca]|uniref:Uncharacterized protein LOC108669162 n=1 Tax=Hyalella azteca TaxID=294128 RepID=A0A8B7NEC2_HYAAZ|nr:uncharacterized protein LOC108669162 [Hyalella azteca]